MQKEIKVIAVGNPNGDWYTLYINSKRACQGHDICHDKIVETLKFLGYKVDYSYEEITDECEELYDGDYLPEDIDIIPIQFRD